MRIQPGRYMICASVSAVTYRAHDRFIHISRAAMRIGFTISRIFSKILFTITMAMQTFHMIFAKVLVPLVLVVCGLEVQTSWKKIMYVLYILSFFAALNYFSRGTLGLDSCISIPGRIFQNHWYQFVVSTSHLCVSSWPSLNRLLFAIAVATHFPWFLWSACIQLNWVCGYVSYPRWNCVNFQVLSKHRKHLLWENCEPENHRQSYLHHFHHRSQYVFEWDTEVANAIILRPEIDLRLRLLDTLSHYYYWKIDSGRSLEWKKRAEGGTATKRKLTAIAGTK